MKVVFGLGNPEKEYVNTRHNVGFMFLDYLAGVYLEDKVVWEKGLSGTFCEIVVNNEKIVLVKPTTFMNNSGDCVSKYYSFYKLSKSDFVVVHDDLDIPFSSYKFQLAKGPKVHNGILSVEQRLGFNDFWRLRIGIENRVNFKFSGHDYVLSRFTKEEIESLQEIFVMAKNVIIDKFVLGKS